mgnify:CR=1 FL=1
MSNKNIKASIGNQLEAKSWQTEAPLRMIMNNLDRDVAENPDELIVMVELERRQGTGNAMKLLCPN